MRGGPGRKASPLLRGPLSYNRPFLQPAVALYEAIGPTTDAATLLDALSALVVQISLADTAAVADTLATLQASLALTDTALGTDALATIQAALALTDTGAAVDALQTLMAGLSLADTAAVANAISTIQAALALTDTAAVANAISTIQAALGTADAGTAADALAAVLAALGMTDAAVGADALTTIRGALSLADTATGADVITGLLAALTLSTGTPYYTEVLADNPLGFWKLAGNSAADASGNNHNGTATGTVSTAGRGTATAMDFDGIDDYVAIPIDLSTHPKITLEFWAKCASFPGGDKLFAEYTANYNGGGGFLVDPNVGPNGFSLNLDDGGYDSLNSVSPSDGALHQYFCVFDRAAAVGSQIRLVIDGVDSGQVDGGFDIVGNFANDTLYLMSRGGASLFNPGQMQDVSLYDGVLSQARMTAHYNASPITASSDTATVTEAVAVAALVVKSFTDSAAVTDTMTKIIEDVEYKVHHGISPVTGMGPAASFEKWLDELQAARKKKEAEQAAIAREAEQRAALEKYAEEQRTAAYSRNVGALLYYVKTGRLTKAQFLATVAREQHKWARVA